MKYEYFIKTSLFTVPEMKSTLYSHTISTPCKDEIKYDEDKQINSDIVFFTKVIVS